MCESQRTTMNFEDFISEHIVRKDSNLEPTHQQFGQFQKRNLHITDEEYPEFCKLYYSHVLKCNRTHNIIERQLIHKDKSPGHHLIDLDFRFQADCHIRKYTDENIQFIIQTVLNEYETLFEMDEEIHFQTVILEKPAPRVETKNSGTIVKDGIHIMFCVAIDANIQKYIRERLLEILPSHLDELPLINKWEDVIDKAISEGINGWLLPNSKKENEPTHYSISKAYDTYYDTDQQKWILTPLVQSSNDLKSYYAQHYKNLFIRNKQIPGLTLLSDSGAEIIQKFTEKNKKPISNPHSQPVLNMDGDDAWQFSVSTVRMVNNIQDATLLFHMFMDNVPHEKYILNSVAKYTFLLPESYYGTGSYNKWIKVGLVLFNTSKYLLIVWLMFSIQSPHFQWTTDVDSICNHWENWKKASKNTEKLTYQSLMYWCKTEVPEKFEKIQSETVDFHLNQCIEGLSIQQLNAQGKQKGSTDYDIAIIVYQLFMQKFKSSSIKNNEWWRITNHYWEKDECGTSLRQLLSTDVRSLYTNKSKQLLEKAFLIKTAEGAVDLDNEEHLLLRAKANYTLNIATRLGNTKDKENIMRECREKFYESDFTKQLDQHRYLLCFNNGVIDFKEKLFRPGKPDDYISKCTRIDYIPLDRARDKIIIEEIEEYFHKLFPVKELYDYMWIHMASLLIGDTQKTQCLHYYIGIGSNGKSLMVNLLEMILGDYAVPLDSSFFICSRGGRGAATPDLAKLPGARLAITSEPTEGGKQVVLMEGPMKQLTSGVDSIVYRGLYKDEESFVPQAHSIIQSNDYISVKSTDHGTWRRIVVIVFLALFTDNPVFNDPDKPYQYKRDDNLKEKFTKWAPVFMAMLVEIAFVYQGSVPMCDYVKKASEFYRKREDYVASFMDDNLEPCPPNPYERLQKSQVNRVFTEWYMVEYGTKPMGKQNVVYDAIVKKYGEYKSQPSQGWDGVRLKKQYASDPVLTTNNTDCDSVSDTTISDHSSL
jgi:P4 family phage/plasmid primase-like protien